MSQILAELDKLVDVVVIDTPPSLVADAQILAGKVDGILFVIQPGTTHAEVARTSMELFKRGGARIIGTVLNRIPRNRSYYYGGYKYYSPYNESRGYYASNGAEPEKLSQKSRRTRQPRHLLDLRQTFQALIRRAAAAQPR
jgi:Mrp family chromosome partitioning ATPase